MVDQTDPKALKQAFEHFSQLSGDLIETYQALEQQVATLTAELESSAAELESSRQKQAQEVQSREQLSEKYIDLLHLLPAGVIVLDKWGIAVEANPFARELLGVEVIGRKWLDIISDCFAPQSDDGHEVSLTNGKRIKLETQALVSQPGQILLLTDQTATRELQEKLAQNERLTAIGQMSSALAHQIRTPLSAALLHAANLRDMPLSQEQSKRFAGKVCDNLQHLESQVRDMLVFSRANIPLEDTLNIAELLDLVRESAQSKYEKARVALQFTLTVDGVNASQLEAELLKSVTIVCNKAVFVGALNNLLINALEASTIGDKVSFALSVNADKLNIVVRDHGVGMDAALLDRINAGEAFVTSKAQGTGLGLTVVRAVAAAHKGFMRVHSERGVGTEVSLQSIAIQRVSTETSYQRSSNVDANALSTPVAS